MTKMHCELQKRYYVKLSIRAHTVLVCLVRDSIAAEKIINKNK